MRIVQEEYPLPVSETRRTGKSVGRVYWVEHEGKRVGPYQRRCEAVAIFKRARRLLNAEVV